ncbi:MAG: hypothetical protein DI629_03715 [Mesorhizobium amorphae]|nr:MAG: hypothetical protein DI629_03715 [Mesorhizobium amorphae]
MGAGEERILRALRRGALRLAKGAGGRMLLEQAGGDAVAVGREALAALLAEGRVVLRGEHLMLSGGDALGAQPQAVVSEGETARNLNESPLASLMRRRDRQGAPFLSDAEFEAGERLRADWTRGSMMPRLGANWEASVASGRRGSGGAGGGVDLSETALAARLRVDKAVTAVGPELAGVLLDVCCFLKGLEQVESERGWPVRSAKIVLKTALGVLARHYRPAEKPRRSHHWGAEDYRPRIGGEES